jgi:heavy metal sensor kinase
LIRALSLRSRLTLWYVVVLLAALSLFAAEALVVQQRLGISRLDRELETLDAAIANVVQSELDEEDTPELAAKEALATVAPRGMALEIVDDRGVTLAAHGEGFDVESLLPRQRLETGVATVQTAEGGWRVRVQPQTFKTAAGPISLTLVVASPLADVRREQRGMQEAILFAIPIAILIAGAGGLWLASVGLRPITEMAEQASRVAPNGIEELGNPDRSDELGQLARAFNGLIARLRSTLNTQRQFMADASHELRTPVSVVRTATQVALTRDHREEGEYREALAVVDDQARRLSQLVGDMLVLARADAGGYTLHPVDLYLDELVAECRRAVDILAAERGVAIHLHGPGEIPFHGDEPLLHQLVLNVLQNAVQHTPAGGSVRIDLETGHEGVALRITDTGPGIPAADRARIFDRFVQLDPARRLGGSGLGLPIAKWIAEAHRGTLVLETSGPGGSSFRIWLPRTV